MSRSKFKVPKFLHLIYVHNPFYLISACLFVYGLKLFLGPGSTMGASPTDDGYIDPWFLMMSLCGVTALMATTAFLIVRFGKVWEDARTIVIVLLLMFMAISVSLDEILNRAAWDALALVLFALLFSIGTSELLIRGLKIRLAWQFRVPFYLFLTLFFVFPLWASPETTQQLRDVIRERVSLFPTLAGLITLTLIPAVRLGSRASRHNGTPWSWPWFPWTVFGFLLPAVCFRSWSFSISLDTGSMNTSPINMETAWGLYQLVPFLFPVLIVLLEIGLVERIRRLSRSALVLAPMLLLMSVPRLSPYSDELIYRAFAEAFTKDYASPVFLTMLALLAFFAFAWMRGLREARAGLVLTGLLTIFVGPRTVDIQSLTLNAWPMLALGPALLVYGFMKQESWPAFVGMSLLSIAAGYYADGTIFESYRTILSSQLLLLSVLGAGAIFDDAFAIRLRRFGAGLLPVTTVLVYVIAMRKNGLTEFELVPYFATLTVLAFAFAKALRDRGYLISGCTNLGLIGARTSWHVLQYLLQLEIPDGVWPIVCGAFCFALAVAISLVKGGLVGRWRQRWQSVDTLPPNGGG